MTTPTSWRIGDAGHTIFGPARGGELSPETVAHVPHRKNVPLLAAAPDLLDACEVCAEYIALTWSLQPESEPGFMRGVRATIAKAKGERS